MKLYGSIERVKAVTTGMKGGGREWVIKCDPHVRLRLKRLFWRLGKQHGIIRVKDTEEICRDLVWFLERYPMQMSDADRAYMEARGLTYDARVESYDMVLTGSICPRPFEMAIPARNYQAVATELLLRSGGLLVVDDLGLGKTVIGIAALTDPRLRPSLVVVPTHLQTQWSQEFEKFLPGMKVHILKKGTPYDITSNGKRRRKGHEQEELFLDARAWPDVIITTYYKLSGWADTLAPIVNSIIFDECQDLRRSESHKAAAARHLAHSVDYRLGLSATPIYNYGGEFFNVLEVLKPDALGTKAEFMREWCGHDSYGGDKAIVKEPKTFGVYLREAGLMIRRTRKDVGRELPEVSRIPHHVDADTKALDTLDDSVAELARIILWQGGNPLRKGQAARDLDWRLRQATGIAKAPFVADFVRLLIESGEKVLLFGWHREVYSIWMSRLKDHDPVLYTGSESPVQKEKAKKAFLQGDTKLLIMSLRSGSGVDGLQQVCRTVVFGELDWSPGVHEQCVGRVHRDGQDEPVMAYFLVSDEGSDPVVADALRLKKGQIEGVRDPEAPIIQKLQLDPEHIKKLARHYLKKRGLKEGPPGGVDKPKPCDSLAGSGPVSGQGLRSLPRSDVTCRND